AQTIGAHRRQRAGRARVLARAPEWVPRRVRVGRSAREAVSARRDTLLRRGTRPPRRSSCGEACALQPELGAQVFTRAEPVPTGTTTPSSPRIASHCWSEVYR